MQRDRENGTNAGGGDGASLMETIETGAEQETIGAADHTSSACVCLCVCVATTLP